MFESPRKDATLWVRDQLCDLEELRESDKLDETYHLQALWSIRLIQSLAIKLQKKIS